MAIKLSEKQDGRILEVHVSGKLTAADYEHFTPQVERLIDKHGKIRMLFDMHDFQQMLLNLFINAIHAMRDGGTLEVKANEDDANLTIAVVDSGCGIEAENIGRIFDPFFTTKPTGEGTGLGLWLTYEIIRNYNGEITVESEPGKGCSFVMKFPVVRKS